MADPFDKQIDDFREKILKFVSAESEWNVLDSDHLELRQTVESLIEELHVATEELRQQNEELIEAEARAVLARLNYQALFHAAPNAYLVTNMMGIIQEANQVAVEMLNIPQDRIVGKPLAAYLHGSALKELLKRLHALASEPETQEWETQLTPRDRKPIDVVISAVRQRAGKDQSRLLVLLRDVTHQKRIERELHESQARFQTIFDAADLGVALLDVKGMFIESNPSCRRIFELPPGSPSTSPYLDNIVAEERASEQLYFLALVNGAQDRYETEYPVARSDGRVIWLRSIMSLVRDGNSQPRYVIGLFEDITLARGQEEEIRQLEMHRDDALERERESLARDLHDGPLQQQIAIIFAIEDMQRSATDEQQQVKLARLREDAVQVVHQLRMTTGLLRSPTLAHFGLVRATESFINQIRVSGAQVEINLEVNDADRPLSGRAQQGLYRIMQNCLTNAIRHSGATQVTVRLYRRADQLVVEVEDNGKGFNVPERWIDLTRDGHYGLVGSAERAAALGGRLHIRSTPGSGTLVRAKIPLRETYQVLRAGSDIGIKIPQDE